MFSEVPSLLVTTPTNIRYLTGFVGAAPEEREAYVLVTSTATYLFTNALYMEEARGLARETRGKRQETGGKQLHIVEISRESPLSRELAKVLGSLKESEIPVYTGMTEKRWGMRIRPVDVRTKRTLDGRL